MDASRPMGLGAEGTALEGRRTGDGSGRQYAAAST